LHGGGTDHARLSWDDTFPALLALGFRVYAPDHPGYGASPLPSWPVTAEHLTTYLREWLAEMEIDRAAFCGISLGGALALGYALDHPERVERLVLVGSYGLQPQAPAHALSYFLVRTPGLSLGDALLRRSPRLLRWALRQIVRRPGSLTDDLVAQVAAAMTNPNAQAAWRQFQESEIQRGGLTTDFSARLGTLRVPTLLIHGSADVGVPVDAARQAARRIPNAELLVFEGAGHWTQRDEPGRFNYALASFLLRPQHLTPPSHTLTL